MQLYERNGDWYFEAYYYDPRTHKRTRARRSTGVKADGRSSSQRAAESVAHSQVGDIASVGGKEKSIAVADSIVGLVKSLERGGRSESTIEIVGTKSKNLYRLIDGKTRLSSITPSTLENYTDTRLSEGAHRGTIHRELRTLRQAWSTAREYGLVDSDPPKVTQRNLDQFRTINLLTGGAVGERRGGWKRRWFKIDGHRSIGVGWEFNCRTEMDGGDRCQNTMRTRHA